MATIIATDSSPTENAWINSLIWGGKWSSGGGTVVLKYYLMSGVDPLNFSGVANGAAWNANEIAAITRAFAAWEAVANIDFVEANQPGDADLWYWLGNNAEVGDGTLGWHEVPVAGTSVSPLYGVFNSEAVGWTAEGLQSGGLGQATLLHELGHGLGLAHPHDGGDDGEVFPGVTSAFGSYGQYDLNQGIWTTMSYNDGWSVAPAVSYDYGTQASAMALDVAAIQQIYGANTSYRTGDDSYALPTVNAVGTGWICIWDAGGVDVISAEGSSGNATINLNDAELTGANAGGYISRVAGILGGVTIAAGVVIEQAIGGDGNDSLTGNQFANRLEGGAGNDTLTGGDGSDTLLAGTGTDVVHGGVGTDTLWFGDFLALYTLQLNALTGSVGVTGNGVSIQCDGIESMAFLDTTIAVSGTFQSNALDGTIGNDFLTGTTGDDRIRGLAGKDTLTGGAGNDYIDGGSGNDRLFGSAGDDSFVIDSSKDVISERANDGSDTVLTTVNGYTLGANLEKLAFTGTGAFIGIGNALANILTGGSGADRLDGGIGGDRLVGAGGGDTYIIDSTADVVEETGASGRDAAQSSVSLTGLWSGVEDATLSASAIVLTGNALGNGLRGNQSANNMSGLGGADTLWGSGGNDTLSGGDGADRLTGGIGVDEMTGGSGADSFVWELATESATALTRVDVIRDFVAGVDVIDLSGMDASTRITGNNTFDWNGAAVFGRNAAGEVRFEKQDLVNTANDCTWVYIDTNDTVRPELILKIVGLVDLTAGDFIL